MGKIADDLDRAIREAQVKSLVYALDWAGSQSALARAIGVKHCAVAKYIIAGKLSTTAAWILSHTDGFELTLYEMRPDIVDWRKLKSMKRNIVRRNVCVAKITGATRRIIKSFNKRQLQKQLSNTTLPD